MWSASRTSARWVGGRRQATSAHRGTLRLRSRYVRSQGLRVGTRCRLCELTVTDGQLLNGLQVLFDLPGVVPKIHTLVNGPHKGMP
jgi:hypothetical protein